MNYAEMRVTFFGILHRGEGNIYLAHIAKGSAPRDTMMVDTSELMDGPIPLPDWERENSYQTINEFGKGSTSRRTENVIAITSIMIDIDCHHGESVDELRKEIDEKVMAGEIPRPTIMVFTGGGYALYYVYRDKMNADDEESVKEHRALYDSVITKARKILPDADIDSKVTDFPRFSRIPGTFNSNRGRWAELIYADPDQYYTPDQLREAFGITKEDLKPTNRQRDRPGRIDKVDAKSILLTGEDEDVKPEVSHKIYTIMKANLQRLDLLFPLRKWKEGDHRERYIFIYYNCAKVVYGSRKARELCLEKWNKMDEKLTEREFEYAIRHIEEHEEISDFHEDGFFLFYIQTIVSSEWLDMTDEEIEKTHSFDSKNRVEARKHNKKIKSKRNQILKKCFDAGMTAKEAHEELVKGGACGRGYSERTVRRIFEGFRKEKEILMEIEKENEKITQLEERDVQEMEKVRNLPFFPSSKQSNAVDMAKEGKNLLIAGCAGSGKTSLMRTIDSELTEMGRKVAIIAPTWQAAKHYEKGMSIHSFFRWKANGKGAPYEVTLKAVAKYETIIIDEASMMSTELFYDILEVLWHVEEKYGRRIQLIIVGDPGQLRPVKGEPLSQNCKPLRNYTIIYLNEVYRQNDGYFLGLLNRLRKGDKYVCDELNQLLAVGEDLSATYIVPYKESRFGEYSADAINDRYVNSLPGKEKVYAPKNGGTSKDSIRIKVGERVLFTENAPKKGYFNGMSGVVTSLTRDYVGVIVVGKDRCPKEIKVHRHRFYDECGRYDQFPLVAGKAITIHKSQGMTLEKANIDPGVFEDGQLYVALSRVKDYKRIRLLKPIKPEDIRASKEAIDFDEYLRTNSII